jgi:hypothetical protein
MREETQGIKDSMDTRIISVMPRLKVGIQDLWLMLPVLLLTYKTFIFPLPPLDFWWHLKVGEVIATTGSIPRSDIFSFTAAGRPFVLQNWLGELIYYWTYRAGGFPMLVFLGTLLTLGAFLLTYKMCLNAAQNIRIAAFVGFLASLANYGFMRPQTFSFLLFAAFYLVLTEYKERQRDRLWILPVLMALWVNLHGAFVIGLGLVGLYLACETWRRQIDPQQQDALSSAELRKLCVVFALCCVTTLLNPEGYRIFEYVRTVVLDAGSQQLVAEWQPPRLNDLLGFLLFYCPFFATLFTFIHARRKPDFTEMVLFLVFAALGLISIRNAAWFSTITFPLLARYLPLLDIGSLLPLRFNFLERLSESSQRDERERAAGWIHSVALGVAVLAVVSQSPWTRPHITGKSLLAEQTPVGVADFMDRQGVTGRLFHTQDFGDYLMWRLWPRQKTFVDGRVHLFDLEFLKQYERTIDDPLSTDLLERWKIQYVLLNKPAGVGKSRAIESVEASGSWSKIYEDGISVLFEKRPAQRGGRF